MDRTPQSSVPSAPASPRMPRKKFLELIIEPQKLRLQKDKLPFQNLETVCNLNRLLSARVRLAFFRTYERRDRKYRVPHRLMLGHIDLVLRAVKVRILLRPIVRHVGKSARRFRRLPAHIVER